MQSVVRKTLIKVVTHCLLPTAQCLLKKGGIAQLARASALQAEGHRFESVYLHSFPISFAFIYRAG